jgi:hypothetical protein
MGSGASFDGLAAESNNNNAARYFCHACHRVFGLGNVDSPPDYCCPHCHSTFLEEFGSNQRRNDAAVAVRHRAAGHLSIEQSRRISSATAMLRLLETQLRDELENLQLAFESANLSINTDSNTKKLSKIMTSKLKTAHLNLDTVCSQPGCPICSEEFVLGFIFSIIKNM